MSRLSNGWIQRFRANLWFAPAVAVVLAVGTAKTVAWFESQWPFTGRAWYLFAGEPESARELLSTVASSTLTLASVVFSITVVVLQLASQQFSSRVLRTFLEDRFTRFSLGWFVFSFVYPLALLPEVRSAGEGNGGAAFVPALAVFVAFLTALVAVGVFARYIHHMAHSIRVAHVAARIAKETRAEIERLFPDEVQGPERPEPDRPVQGPDRVVNATDDSGVVTDVDAEGLLSLAEEHDAFIEIAVEVGRYVPRGAPLFRIWGGMDLRAEELFHRVSLADERTVHQDPAFGFRQLVDIAERALSPGINDPTTAVQVLDHLHDLLRLLVGRELPPPVRTTEAGRPRLVVPRPGWGAYVQLALDEITPYATPHAQVRERLRGLMDDLIAIAPAGRRPPLEAARARLVDEGAAARRR